MCFEIITHFFRSDRITNASHRIERLLSELNQAHHAYQKVAEGEPIEQFVGYELIKEIKSMPFGYGAHRDEEQYFQVPIYQTIGYNKPDAATLDSAKKVITEKIIDCRDHLIGEYNKLLTAFRNEYYGKALEELQPGHKKAFNFMVYVSEKLESLSSTTSYYDLEAAVQYIDRECVRNNSFKNQCEAAWSELQNEYDELHVPHAKYN